MFITVQEFLPPYCRQLFQNQMFIQARYHLCFRSACCVMYLFHQPKTSLQDCCNTDLFFIPHLAQMSNRNFFVNRVRFSREAAFSYYLL